MFTACLLFALTGGQFAFAQFNAPYTDSWIAYGKSYVKIGITKKGLHRISFASLPKTFSVGAPEKLQLWRRGKQVSIISTTNNEILFYAVPNDGARDSLLYRPTSARMNPYYSLYSDEEAYFLVNGDAAGNRAKVVNQAVDQKVAASVSHEELATTVLSKEYSLSTTSAVQKEFFNSYFEIGASRTGQTIKPGNVATENFALTNISDGLSNASIKMMVHGRSNLAHSIEVYVGKDANSLRLVNTINNYGFEGTEFTFKLLPADVDANKKGVLTLKIVGTERLNWFSLAYYSIGYNQQLDMTGLLTKEFRFGPANVVTNRLQIKGAPANATSLDISNTDDPIVVRGSYDNLMLPRTSGKAARLLVTNEIFTIAAEKMTEMSFKTYDAKSPNYIIITHKNLLDGVNQYAAYRASKEGGAFKPLIVDIADLYNQFNYGEPSPLAIKQFMAYMLGQGGKDKHLFLVGKSISANEKMIRELPLEVPTYGYPGSDALLVSGLLGEDKDIPLVPVGRLSAISNQQIVDYLTKVKDYEQNSAGDLGWRKNVLHLNGGKTLEEITQLRDLLGALVPDVTNGVVGGKVTPYVKKQAMAETEVVNITPDVNSGVGLITYFGHGSTVITDLDMGYVTDASRGYNNPKKYPMMYFNGCGVGNIFQNKFNPNPGASDRTTLSLDWLMAPNRGAIAIVANSFESFVSPAANYLDHLYSSMFVEPATVNLTIGQIQLAVAKKVISQSRDSYNVSNVHQSLLQGDPVLKLVTVDKPDYAVSASESITLNSQSKTINFDKSDSLRLNVVISNEGRFVKGQKVPVRFTYFGSKGNKVSSQTVSSFPYQDTLYAAFINSKDVQRIEVSIDPDHTISELNLRNNVAELELDWDFLADKFNFSSANNKDVTPPVLTVNFNGRMLNKQETIAPNPTISLYVQDDRQIFADTALVDVYIKRCADESCEFEKVAYASQNFTSDSINTHEFQLNLNTTDFPDGDYEILANARDLSGNISVQAYRMSFKISTEFVATRQMVVSPNPASTYVKFSVIADPKDTFATGRFLIYNQAGLLVEDKLTTISTSNFEWYWMPGSSTPAGLYAYKVVLSNDQTQASKTLSGKLVLIK
ncbi:putative type IX secretion system sortase PorU2 [Dyadobacter luticola]|nr:C25 family cysteine peptidase [Dyadobacter luticola]